MPGPSSGCFVMTKSVRQHKIVKSGKLQKSESSLICVIISEGSTNALPVNTSILANFCIPVSLHNKNVFLRLVWLGRSTTEQIFNLWIIWEKYHQHQQDLYHVFMDFKKAFGSVWHTALWATVEYNISTNLIRVIKILYDKATSAVLFNSCIGDCFRAIVGVRQGCLLSPTLFNVVF